VHDLAQPGTTGSLRGAASAKLRHGSLFTGVGGIDLGLEWAGFETVWQVENNAFARKVLERHWEDVPRFTDVRECGRDNLERVDIISGGFPCQQVSCAGKREGIGTAECPTERSGLWFEFLRIVRELRPPWVLVENVSRLLRTGDGDTVLSDMERAGYSCTPLVVGAEILGAPHERKRAWILCRDKAADRPGIGAVMTGRRALPQECQRRMEEARGRWGYWKDELRGGSLGTCLPRTITPTATAILVKDWSWDDFIQLPSGRWRKRTKSGKVDGSMSWAQEMAARAAAQGNPRLEPTPEFCEDFMGFPAGWTELGADPVAARYARIVRGVRGIPDWADRLRALGNAAVPQIPMLIGCFIRRYESQPAVPADGGVQEPWEGFLGFSLRAWLVTAVQGIAPGCRLAWKQRTTPGGRRYWELKSVPPRTEEGGHIEDAPCSRIPVLGAREGGQPPSEIKETGGKGMAARPEAPVKCAGGATRKPNPATNKKKKRSPQQEQYYRAIAMSDADLGAAIKDPTERIARHLDSANAHDGEARKERAEAQREFRQNLALYYEAKQRLLNPGYRADINGGRDRTPGDNGKNFGAPDWATFNKRCKAYSLQHADRMLKAFAKAHGLLTDEGENIDDPEDEEEAAGRPQPRRTEDPTAQRRYEFIAAAAMDIASKNPEGEVERQILAAAEYLPAPLMPVPPDLFTEVLNFLTSIPTMVAHAGIIAEARQLAAKMRLHKPVPEAAAVPAEIAKEEKRKRDKRLEKKNGGPPGGAACTPRTSGTSEHVQRSATAAEGTGGTAPTSKVEARRLRKAKNQRDYCRRQKEAQSTAMAATPSAPRDAGSLEAASQDEAQPAAAPAPGHGEARGHTSPPRVTACTPALGPEEEERKHGTLDAVSSHPGRRNGDFVLNEEGRWEYDPEDGAQALCGRLGAPPVAGIVPQHACIQPPARPAA